MPLLPLGRFVPHALTPASGRPFGCPAAKKLVRILACRHPQSRPATSVAVRSPEAATRAAKPKEKRDTTARIRTTPKKPLLITTPPIHPKTAPPPRDAAATNVPSKNVPVLISPPPARSKRPFVPSPEQLEVVELLRTHNVIVSARPGSGKTATAQAIVAANPGLRILILTYSKRLQLETKLRLSEFADCDVFTFHGFATRLFCRVARTDAVLHDMRREGVPPVWPGVPYDIVILDEIQDCTEILFWLVCSSIISMTRAADGKAPKLVVLGDERQAIYAFRGADPRYLTHAGDAMSSLTPYAWKHKTLSKSFRLSHQSATFLNDVFLGGDNHIQGSHDAEKPIYLHINPWETEAVASELLPLIQKYGPQNTAILAMSTQQNPTISRLTNLLSEIFYINVATPLSDDAILDDRVVHGKLSVSTFHQFKGNERDLVIVYGMDDGYFQWGAQDMNPSTCPNELYVAVTRAIKQLVIMHYSQQPALPFISVPHVHKTAKYVNIGAPALIPNPRGGEDRYGLVLPQRIVPSKMAKHMMDDELRNIIDAHLVVKQTKAPLPGEPHIAAPDVVLSDKVRGHHEAVSDLNGIAVVAAYEYDLLGTLNSLGYERIPARIPSGDRRAMWFCRRACQYDARVSLYRSRLIQLKDHPFDWLGPHLDVATKRLKSHLRYHRDDLAFEVPLETKFSVDSQKTELVGRADIVATEDRGRRVTTWEIKCVAELSPTHVVQTATYGYLWAIRHGNGELPCMKLYNVLSGEELTILSPRGVPGVKDMIEEVLRAKYTRREAIPTEEFVKGCDKVRIEVEAMFGGEGGED